MGLKQLSLTEKEELTLVDDYRIGYDRCPNCLSFIQREWKYCGNCGFNLK